MLCLAENGGAAAAERAATLAALSSRQPRSPAAARSPKAQQHSRSPSKAAAAAAAASEAASEAAAAAAAEVRAAAGGLQRAQLSREALADLGLADDAAAGRLYHLLFVYSFGMANSLDELTRRLPDASRAALTLRVWRTVVGIGEQLLRASCRTELLELLHGMEDEVGAIAAAAKQNADDEKRERDELRATLDAALRVGDAHSAAARDAAVFVALLATEVGAGGGRGGDGGGGRGGGGGAAAGGGGGGARGARGGGGEGERTRRARGGGGGGGARGGGGGGAAGGDVGAPRGATAASPPSTRRSRSGATARRRRRRRRRGVRSARSRRRRRRVPSARRRAVLGRELDGERRRSAGERRALAAELSVHEAGWRSAHRLAVGAEEVAARHKQRWRESGDECKMLATRGLASIAQLREALGEGGERVEASVDAVERVLRELQGAWKEEG